MKTVSLAFALVFAAMLAIHPVFADGHGKKSKTFVVVSSASAETQAMAMVLSMQAQKNGSEVRVLLCDAGGDMALKNYSGKSLQPKNVTPQMLLKKVMANGATVNVCALYMPNRGLSEADLIEGVKGVKPPIIGTYMADSSVRYFTF